MNINQQNQKENRQDFQIDQNEQNINRLRKQTKALSDNIDTLSQSALVSQTDISSIKTDLATAKSDIEQLKSSGSTTEEKVELQSYDCYKTKDRIYRDTCWLPRPIGFVAESGKMFKFRVKFDAFSSFETTITSTAKITFDEEEIYSDTKEIPAGGTHAVDFEYITSSEKMGHKLIIELRNTETPKRRTNCCIPDMLTVELWGTNVQFVSRNNDFCVIPAGNNVVMTTMIYDHPQALFSMQPADANLSLEQASFKFCKANNYRNYNTVLPAIVHTYDTTKKTVIYSNKPSLIIHNFQTDAAEQRIGHYYDVDGNNEEGLGPDNVILVSRIAKSLFSNSGNVYSYGTIPNYVTISENGYLFLYDKGGLCPILSEDKSALNCVDCCGAMRLDNNNSITIFYGVATRLDGTSFFWSQYTNPSQRLELGFGTHSNVYILANNNIVIFLRVGKNMKKITLTPDPEILGYYKILDISIISNVQEYWLMPNNTHFERVGNKIKYFVGSSSTPAQALTTF